MAIRIGRRLLSAYAESEPWEKHHDLAMFSYKIEETITYGLSLFQGLSNDDALWQDHVLKKTIPYDEEVLAQFAEDYRAWSEVSKKVLEAAEWASERGFSIGGLNLFRQAILEADCILEAEALESELPPVEEMIHLANRGNPRPERYGD